jgi:hypothetical protein
LPSQYGNLDPSVCQDLKNKVMMQADRKKQELFALFKLRNHEHVTGITTKWDSFNSQNYITVRCLIHNQTFQTKVTNYKRSKKGLPCCGKQSVIDLASKRQRHSDGTFKPI